MGLAHGGHHPPHKQLHIRISLSLASFSLHNEQTIPSTAHNSIARRFCWGGPTAAAGNPVAKVTTTAFCRRHAGAGGQPLHHRRVTQPQSRTSDIVLFHVTVSRKGKGPKTVLILNCTAVKRVRGYAEASARKFSYVLSPFMCSIPKTQLEQGISEIPEQE